MFGINGLLYIPGYISPPHHDFLVQTIDAQPWRGDLARRTQHYGYVYDYRARKVEPSAYLGALPPWLQRIAAQLRADELVQHEPDQAIINEYEPGQGIADHVDCTPCFNDVVISLSLASAVVMDVKQKGQSVPVLLEPRSLLVLRGEARYDWTHGIARRQHDTVNGEILPRGRRLSVTFR
nr:alpha-ketoglutarate-dependent dioxygenase AlkB [Chloroflexaceae bacterium]